MKKNTALIIILMTLFSFGCSSKKEAVIPPAPPRDHNQEAIEFNANFFRHPEELHSFSDNKDIDEENIVKCAMARKEEESCTVAEAPFLGLGKEEVTIDDIIAKTIATKKSHIDTLRIVLNMMPKETLIMFGSVNAIVISERIVPSFYSFYSGAIYLDASDIWTTAPELTPQDTTKEAAPTKDYRMDYGLTLPYLVTYNYVKDRKTIDASASKKERTAEELAPSLISLLFHELSHANDFFSRSFYSSSELDVTKTVYDMMLKQWEKEKILSQAMPTHLASASIKELGQILYQGKEVSNDFIKNPVSKIFKEFTEDTAADMYAYSTDQEDLAMLSERALFYHYFKYSNYILFMSKAPEGTVFPEDHVYTIDGGIKNKILDPKVRTRAQYVLEKIFSPDFAKTITTHLSEESMVIIPPNTPTSEVKNY